MKSQSIHERSATAGNGTCSCRVSRGLNVRKPGQPSLQVPGVATLVAGIVKALCGWWECTCSSKRRVRTASSGTPTSTTARSKPLPGKIHLSSGEHFSGLAQSASRMPSYVRLTPNAHSAMSTQAGVNELRLGVARLGGK